MFWASAWSLTGGRRSGADIAGNRVAQGSASYYETEPIWVAPKKHCRCTNYGLRFFVVAERAGRGVRRSPGGLPHRLPKGNL